MRLLHCVRNVPYLVVIQVLPLEKNVYHWENVPLGMDEPIVHENCCYSTGFICILDTFDNALS